MVSVADAVALATFTDGVVLVVQTGKVPYEVDSPRGRADPGREGTHPRRRMNAVNLKRDGYYYDYYRYYHSYYNETEGSKRR